MKDIRFDGALDYQFQNVGFVSVLRNAGHVFDLKNGKARCSFLYVLSGEMECRFENGKKTFRLEQGSCLFVPKESPYQSAYLKDHTVIKMIVFDFNAKRIPSFFERPFCEKSPELTDIFHSITSYHAGSAAYLTAKLYEIMFYLESVPSKIPKKYRRLFPALSEVKKGYTENKKLAYYAELCSMSQSNFRRLFKEYTGKSFVEYRNAIRISAAKEMIDSGEFSVSEAAYLAGFHNMSFFYEVYHRYTKK